jgi:hypothetical protein
MGRVSRSLWFLVVMAVPLAGEKEAGALLTQEQAHCAPEVKEVSLSYQTQFQVPTIHLPCVGADRGGTLMVRVTLNAPLTPWSAPRLVTPARLFAGTLEDGSAVFRLRPYDLLYRDLQGARIDGLIADTSKLPPRQPLTASITTQPIHGFPDWQVWTNPAPISLASPPFWCQAFAVPAPVALSGPVTGQGVGDFQVTCAGGAVAWDHTTLDVVLHVNETLSAGAAPELIVDERAPMAEFGGARYRGERMGPNDLLFRNVKLRSKGGAAGTFLRVTGVGVDLAYPPRTGPGVEAVLVLGNLVPAGSLFADLAFLLPPPIPGPRGPAGERGPAGPMGPMGPAGASGAPAAPRFRTTYVTGMAAIDPHLDPETWLADTARYPSVFLMLPAASEAGNGKMFVIKRTAGDGQILVVAADGSIEGHPGILVLGRAALTVISDGASWWVLSGDFEAN